MAEDHYTMTAGDPSPPPQPAPDGVADGKAAPAAPSPIDPNDDTHGLDFEALGTADFGEAPPLPAEGTGEVLPPTTEGEAPEKPDAVDAAAEGEAIDETVAEAQPAPISAEDAKKFRESVIEGLTHFYSMDEETAAELSADPTKVMPKLLAKAHYAAVEASTIAMMNLLPNYLEKVTRQIGAREQAGRQFFVRWPGLEPHQKKVAEVGAIWRQMNPDAPLKTFVEEVGKIVVNMVKPQTAPLRAAPTRGAPAGRRVAVSPAAGGIDWSELAELDYDA